jgi:hypothetical protein
MSPQPGDRRTRRVTSPLGGPTYELTDEYQPGPIVPAAGYWRLASSVKVAERTPEERAELESRLARITVRAERPADPEPIDLDALGGDR